VPWLHMIFDAWEDHRKMREREEAELLREQQEMAERVAALIETETTAEPIAQADDDDDGGKKKKKRKKKND